MGRKVVTRVQGRWLKLRNKSYSATCTCGFIARYVPSANEAEEIRQIHADNHLKHGDLVDFEYGPGL